MSLRRSRSTPLSNGSSGNFGPTDRSFTRVVRRMPTVEEGPDGVVFFGETSSGGGRTLSGVHH